MNYVISPLPAGIPTSLYIDDFVIYTARDNTQAQALIQSAITASSTWTTSHGFHFSITRSHGFTVTRSLRIRNLALYLYDTPLRDQTVVAFFSLICDPSTHTERTRFLPLNHNPKAPTTTNTLAYLMGRWPFYFTMPYTSLVLSILDYGCRINSFTYFQDNLTHAWFNTSPWFPASTRALR